MKIPIPIASTSTDLPVKCIAKIGIVALWKILKQLAERLLMYN